MSSHRLEPALDTLIPAGPRAPSDARRAMTELAALLHPALLRDVQLLVSELVTNSVRHSGSEDAIRLRVWSRADTVKVEVADGGFGFEGTRTRARPADAVGGLGLVILEKLADRWGVGPDARGRVWFELAAARAADQRAQAR